MRIIAGKYGGRKIHPPAKMPYTRPTTDVAKEGLFNILENNVDISSLETLDLFGGTGSITYELASRGAKKLTIVEKDPKMYAFIKNNMERLAIENCTIHKADVFSFIAHTENTFDFIFAGPPYALEEITMLPGLVANKNLLNKNGWFILEHTPANNFELEPMFKTRRKYGTTVFSFFINK
ncbi:RsmD family RNA methyltransferase [soil metagenome]